MGETTGISWCDHTWNPWIGCRKVSPACTHCYAATFVGVRLRRPFYPEPTEGHKSVDADSPVWRTTTWREPVRWDRRARETGRIRSVFTCSLSDFFLDHSDVHTWREEAWSVIRQTPNLLWLVLSKRWTYGHDYILSCLPPDWGEGYPNVMLGVTAENQETAAERLWVACSIPCRQGLFVSCEPLLGEVNLANLASRRYVVRANALEGVWMSRGGEGGGLRSRVRWVIGGAETGALARPTELDWARQLRDDALFAGVPFCWKQWGTWSPVLAPSHCVLYEHSAPDAIGMVRVGVKLSGRLLDGQLHDAGPSN